MPTAISLAIGSILSQYLLINIRIQASKRERIETDFSLDTIQFQSGPRLNEDTRDGLGSTHSVLAATP